MRITKAVVPAGGLGTRLRPITRSVPKEMLPLGARPVIQSVAEELAGAGATDILIITGAGKRAIEDHFDPGGAATDPDASDALSSLLDRSRVRFYATRQGAPRGLGDAIACGEQFAGEEHFLVALGDCVIVGAEPSGPVRRMLAAHIEADAAASILVQRVSLEATGRYGIVKPGADVGAHALAMADIVEKPGPEAAPSRLAVCARYVFSPTLFDYLRGLEPGHGAEIQLTDAVRAMIADGHRVLAVPLQAGEMRLDVGNVTSYTRAFVRTMLTDAEHGEGLRAWTAKLLQHLDDPTTPDPDQPEPS